MISELSLLPPVGDHCVDGSFSVCGWRRKRARGRRFIEANVPPGINWGGDDFLQMLFKLVNYPAPAENLKYLYCLQVF